MKHALFYALAMTSLATLAAGTAAAAGTEKFDLGKMIYESKCALCHGKSGRGDGGVADLLKKAPRDLTTLARDNFGVFPVDRVVSFIDGRQWVAAHGERDMPIWGLEFQTETVKAASYYIDMPYSMEMYTRTSEVAIVDYLHRLQVK